MILIAKQFILNGCRKVNLVQSFLDWKYGNFLLHFGIGLNHSKCQAGNAAGDTEWFLKDIICFIFYCENCFNISPNVFKSTFQSAKAGKEGTQQGQWEA